MYVFTWKKIGLRKVGQIQVSVTCIARPKAVAFTSQPRSEQRFPGKDLVVNIFRLLSVLQLLSSAFGVQKAATDSL